MNKEEKGPMNRHKMMAEGKPIKAAKGGIMCKREGGEVKKKNPKKKK